MIDVRIGKKAMQWRIDRGGDRVVAEGAHGIHRHHVVFAVDAVFLFPWATVFAAPGFGAISLGEMFVFLGFLAVGLLYAWRKGVLTWA